MSDVARAKADMRSAAIALRDRLPEALRISAAREIAWNGLACCGLKPRSLVSGFCAIGAEIDPAGLLAGLALEGHRLALPVVSARGQPLVFRSWAPGEPLRSGVWGIREPMPEAVVVEPEVLLVPLLAFDRAGRRLGYGAGFYDRTLARLRAMRPTLAIGVAYDEQEVEDVPVTACDEPLDWVLTPSGARRVVEAI